MKFEIKSLTRIGLMAAIFCVLGPLAIPIGPVPITIQTFVVLLAGLILTPKEAFFSTLLYVLIGILGLPVFAGFRGGFQTIVSPTFGFLISFIVAAPIISKLVGDSTDMMKFIIPSLVGVVIFYLIGLPWLYVVLKSLGKLPVGFSKFFELFLIPFIPGAIIKVTAVILIAPKIKKAIQKYN